jgi:HAMP domain-containing protein
VQDDAEKVRRTEAMKEVTVAYQAGDFARLVELERSWEERESVEAREEDREARIEALVKAIGELKRQLKGLEKDVRSVRATREWKMTAELKKQSKKGDPIAKVREQANAEVQPLRDTHAHLRRYEQGEITVEELLAGPRRLVDVDDDGLALRAEDLEQILAMVAMGARRGKGRARHELDMMSVLEAIGAVLEVRAQGEIGMEEIAEALEALRDDLEERLRPRGKGRRAPSAEEAHARDLFHIVETLTVLAGTMRDMAVMERKVAGGRRRR